MSPEEVVDIDGVWKTSVSKLIIEGKQVIDLVTKIDAKNTSSYRNNDLVITRILHRRAV